MKTLIIEDIPAYIDSVMPTLSSEWLNLELNDGTVEIFSNDMIVLYTLWLPYRRFGLPITKDMVYDISRFTCDIFSKIQTVQYHDILNKYYVKDDDATYTNDPKISGVIVNHMEIVIAFYDASVLWDMFAKRHFGAYQETMDIMDLIELSDAPELQDILGEKIDTTKGTKYAEMEYDRRAKILIERLSDPDAIKDNPLIVSMMAGVFKSNQVPQLLLGFGTRADIDDTLAPHIITESGIEGIGSAASLATEMLSSKKTVSYTSTAIGIAQTLNTAMRLRTCTLIHRHYGSCGNKENTVMHTIRRGRTHNYIDKVHIVDGKRISITRHNHRTYADTTVDLVSPFTCQLFTGICESCSGRATQYSWAFFPEISPGGHTAATLFTKISQKLLSAKHLVRTDTIRSQFTPEAAHYFMLSEDYQIRPNPESMEKMGDWELLIPISSVGHLDDIANDFTTPAGFGLFDKVGLKNLKTDNIDMLTVDARKLTQLCSENLLQHMRKTRSKIKVVNANYHIPLAGFNRRSPLFDIVEMNDDLKAFLTRVTAMFRTGVSEYSNAQIALQSVADLILEKIDVNIFYIEIVLKAMLGAKLGSDQRLVLHKLGRGIGDSSIVSKFTHNEVYRYLTAASTGTRRKQASPSNGLFGFAVDETPPPTMVPICNALLERITISEIPNY